MAHKHNRRRIRHRTRRNRYESNLPTLHESSYDSLSSICDEPSFDLEREPLPPMISISHGFFDGITLQKSWLNTFALDRSCGCSAPPLLYPYTVSKEEVRAIRTFGGEPGEGPDEVGLCGKMQEMFDSMEWMDT